MKFPLSSTVSQIAWFYENKTYADWVVNDIERRYGKSIGYQLIPEIFNYYIRWTPERLFQLFDYCLNVLVRCQRAGYFQTSTEIGNMTPMSGETNTTIEAIYAEISEAIARLCRNESMQKDARDPQNFSVERFKTMVKQLIKPEENPKMVTTNTPALLRGEGNLFSVFGRVFASCYTNKKESTKEQKEVLRHIVRFRGRKLDVSQCGLEQLTDHFIDGDIFTDEQRLALLYVGIKPEGHSLFGRFDNALHYRFDFKKELEGIKLRRKHGDTISQEALEYFKQEGIKLPMTPTMTLPKGEMKLEEPDESADTTKLIMYGGIIAAIGYFLTS